MEYYQQPISQVLQHLRTSEGGLAYEEASARIGNYGPNRLPAKEGTPPLVLFLQQFKSFLVIILIVATFVSALLGEIVDAVVIFVIVILNAVFGFLQEFKAGKAIEALKRMTAPAAVVLRNGIEKKIPASELVPGDILVLSAGEKIPADARLIEAVNLKLDESSLTGESTSVDKYTTIIQKKAPVADRKNMVFMNTVVTYGRGKAVVTSTGLNTQIGKIAEMLEAEEEETTPLEAQLDVFGKKLGVAVLIICAIVAISGILSGNPAIEMFLVGVSLAVAAVPEGLPAIVTVTLAIGLTRMVKRNAIVRKLQAVEALGAADVICSDKTGTLTKNEMTVREIYTTKAVQVTGTGYQIKGDFLAGGKKIKPGPQLNLLLQAAACCNDSRVQSGRIIGDPTEASLVVAAAKAGFNKYNLDAQFERVGEVPFDSTRKRMSTVHKVPGGYYVFSKGAPDILLEKCSKIMKGGKVVRLSEKERQGIHARNNAMAKKALRVLLVAYKKTSSGSSMEGAVEKDLVVLGLVGMIDPPRPEVMDAVRLCRKAGIRPVMITGDHIITAEAIASEIGILGKGQRALTGEDLNGMDEAGLAEIVDEVSVFGRVSPEHKVRILQALQNKGHIVAMTGDGVNDAPALKRADIGVAMGRSGTDVAKGASDMILTDDNFASIVSAVEEGRGIYDNIRKFIKYLLSANSGEVLTMFFGTMIGFPLPLVPVQILWINLVTDGLPAMALGLDPKEEGLMERKPRRKDAHFLDKRMLTHIPIVGVTMCVTVLTMFAIGLPLGIEKARTFAMTTLMLTQMFNALTCRSESHSAIKAGLFKNRYLVGAIAISIILQIAVVHAAPLQALFKTTSMTLFEWLRILLVSSIVFYIIEGEKWWRQKK